MKLQHSSVPVVHYPIAALISLDEFDAPKVNSNSLEKIPRKSILARFSERTEGGVKVETGRIWVRSQSQRGELFFAFSLLSISLKSNLNDAD